MDVLHFESLQVGSWDVLGWGVFVGLALVNDLLSCAQD
jgi:hypothetical protein